MVTKINIAEALQKKAVFIDTRSPAEYELDHLPNAINLPILDNEERAIVGTLYKQVSREKAIEKGVEYFSAKLPQFMKEVDKHKNELIIIYCWRGGMRSRTVVALLESLGYNILQLAGGHKAFRAYVRERLENYILKAELVVFWGLTCTGKTRLLQNFSNFLDLEELAQHRGSLYGHIGLKPNSQKRFENLFLQRLDQLNKEKYLFVEGESRKIGDVQIPEFFYKAMLKGKHVLVERSMEKRAEEAVKNYMVGNNIEDIKKITLSLFKLIGKERKKEIVELIDKGELREAAKILLEEYYDPLYLHTLKKRAYEFKINNDDTGGAVKKIHSKLL